MEEFIVKLANGHQFKGAAYKKDGSVRNILIQTGMAEHSTRYERFAKVLNEIGFDVYVLDAAGQGLNAESVDAQQKWYKGAFADNVEAMHQKIEELKKETGKETCLMGHSMGSFMTQSYLCRFPGTASRVIICGSNGGAKALMKVAFFLAKLTTTKGNFDKPSHFMENMGLGSYTKAIKDRETDVDWLSYDKDNVKAYIADPYCGHRCTCGFWKEFLRGMSTLWDKKNIERVSKEERILIIAGDGDPVGNMGKGPKTLYKMYKDLGVKDVTIHIYPHMRHEILNEKDHAAVEADIKEFLNKE